jgi:hypothetical protein
MAHLLYSYNVEQQHDELLRMWKEEAAAIFIYHPTIRLEFLGKSRNGPSQHSRSPVRDLNPGPPVSCKCALYHHNHSHHRSFCFRVALFLFLWSSQRAEMH